MFGFEPEVISSGRYDRPGTAATLWVEVRDRQTLQRPTFVDCESAIRFRMVLLAENVLHEWQGSGAHLAELLDYARLRPLASASLQTSLL